MQKNVRICSYCAEKGITDDKHELIIFKRYVDGIVFTANPHWEPSSLRWVFKFSPQKLRTPF